jgi:hypothetical protein
MPNAIAVRLCPSSGMPNVFKIKKKLQGLEIESGRQAKLIVA